MFFSKSCEYGLRATIYLAQLQPEEKVGIKVISEDLKLPTEYLSKILQSLVRHNLVSSHKGRNGGFFLTKSELNSPLIKIVHAIDGKDIFARCGLGIDKCSKSHPCPIHNDIAAYRNELKRVLSDLSAGTAGEKINSGVTFLSK